MVIGRFSHPGSKGEQDYPRYGLKRQCNQTVNSFNAEIHLLAVTHALSGPCINNANVQRSRIGYRTLTKNMN